MQNIWDNNDLINILKTGGVAVMPTDTIYGIVGRAEDEVVVERIYKIRKRNESKPFIILISEWSEVLRFGVEITKMQENFLAENFPASRPTTIILDCAQEKFVYLYKGMESLAFRIPQNQDLINLLKQTGPLVAPSANTEGHSPSTNIEQAKNYFGDLVDIYIDGGELNSNASRIIRLFNDGRVDIIRE